MIAPNDKTAVGRNDACPCGSGLRYRHCCRNPKLRAMREDHIRMKVLAHMFLTTIQKMTGQNGISVPAQGLMHYPVDAQIEVMRDPETGAFLFRARRKEPKLELVVPGRRIVTA
jgi:hypothetical protein